MIVICDEHNPRVAGVSLNFLCRDQYGLTCWSELEIHLDDEIAPGTAPTCDAQTTTQSNDQALGNCQAESCALHPSLCTRDAMKRLEYLSELLGLDSNTGVFYSKSHALTSTI